MTPSAGFKAEKFQQIGRGQYAASAIMSTCRAPKHWGISMSGMQQRSDDRTYLGLHLSVDERRRQLDVELTRYVGVLNAEEEALRHEEWKQLSNTQKFLALRNSTLAGDIRWARANPAADIALAVRDLIYFVADMHDGCCWISARRIAELFGRSERTIREYLRRLCSHGLIRKINRPGRAQGYYPLIYRPLVDLSAQPIWFVDAFSPRKTQYGRPAGLARAEEKPRNPDAGVYGKTPEASCINPGSLLPTESTSLTYHHHHPKKESAREACDSKDSKREVVEVVEGEVLAPIMALDAAGLVDDFHTQMQRLKGENALTVLGTSKDDAARELHSQICVYEDEPPEIVAKAVKGAIVALRGKKAQPDLGNFSSLFSKVLSSKIQEAKLQVIELETAVAAGKVKLDTEQEASRKRMGALDKAIHSGEQTRAQRAANSNPQSNRRLTRVDAVISELVEKHNLREEAILWLRPLLSMPRHNSDPIDWALMMVETTKDLPIDVLNWAAEEAAKDCKWCPVPSIIREAVTWKASRDKEDEEIAAARQRWEQTNPESTSDDDFERWLETNEQDVASTLMYRTMRHRSTFNWQRENA
jgi:hypothetical protein